MDYRQRMDSLSSSAGSMMGQNHDQQNVSLWSSFNESQTQFLNPNETFDEDDEDENEIYAGFFADSIPLDNNVRQDLFQGQGNPANSGAFSSSRFQYQNNGFSNNSHNHNLHHHHHGHQSHNSQLFSSLPVQPSNFLNLNVNLINNSSSHHHPQSSHQGIFQQITSNILQNAVASTSSSSNSSQILQQEYLSRSFSNYSTPKIYSCDWADCNSQYTSESELVTHIEYCHIDQQRYCHENYTCYWNNCIRNLRPFNARYKLLNHMRIHSGEKPNKCPEPGCTKAFSRQENLKIHIRSHTGEKPFLCTFIGCMKAFSNSSDRAKHQRTHFNPVSFDFF